MNFRKVLQKFKSKKGEETCHKNVFFSDIRVSKGMPKRVGKKAVKRTIKNLIKMF